MKRRLVVVGNGMAGARLVEEVLARGGGDQFEIVMFGDEPYGNYNRILLSSVLAGAHDPRDIFINPLTWYHENTITLHAGVRASRIDRAARVRRAVARSGSRQPSTRGGPIRRTSPRASSAPWRPDTPTSSPTATCSRPPSRSATTRSVPVRRRRRSSPRRVSNN